MTDKWKDELIVLLKSKFEGEASGHDWYHINRVKNIALKIGEKEGGNQKIIEIGALLHDISDYKFNGGDFLKGGIIGRQILERMSIDETTIQAVTHIIDNISFKGSKERNTMRSLEGRIVQDADRLDAIGAIGIARTFAYGGSIGQVMFNPNIPPKENQSKPSYINERTHTINHFYEKLLLLKDRMNTETGRKMAAERQNYMLSFLEQFYKEWGCI